MAFSFEEAMKKALEDKKKKLMQVLETVLIDMVNWIKQNHTALGGWENRTANLENSISYQAPKTGSDGKIVGVIYAGMEYALYVEFSAGHWVLSGGLNEFQPKLLQLIKERMSQL